MDPLTAYYVNQSGGRLGDLGPLYVGSPFVQRGEGIGSFLGGLFRMIKPVLFSGAKAVGRETLSAGANILSDIVQKKPDEKVKNIVKRRVNESTKRLVDKMKGNGRRKRKRVEKREMRDIFNEVKRRK